MPACPVGYPAELHARGPTIFLSTHYMEEADQLCDRVAIMDHGQILALDTPQAQGVRRRRHHRHGHGRGDLEALARLLRARVDGAIEARQMSGKLQLHVKGATASCLR